MDKLIFKEDKDFPLLLREINDPPKSLHVRGNIEPLINPKMKVLCIVGARKYSNYGKEVVEKLIEGLRGYNICIVSGLALGIDSIAHRAALKAGLYTVAFPGSGLNPEVIYPHSHKRLAEEIVTNGGALISEFKMDQEAAIWTFPSRNRLMAGVSKATVVIECSLVSGTLITSARALDYNREVGAVPGSIFSPLSAGPHILIGKGAMAITSVDDLLELLGLPRRKGQSRLPLEDDPKFNQLEEDNKKVVRFLINGPMAKDTLIRDLGMDAKVLNTILSSLEMEGFIKEEGGHIRIM